MLESRSPEVTAALLVVLHLGRGTAVVILVDQIQYLKWLMAVQLYVK